MYKITETQFDELPKELQDLYEKLPNHSREEVLECFPNESHRFFKQCNDDICQDQSQTSSVQNVEHSSISQERHTAPKVAAISEVLEGLESQEVSPASQDSTGNSENFSQTQNPVSNAESQESTDTTQTTQSSTKSSGSAPLATGESTKQESQSVVNVQVQGMRLVYQAKASKKDRDEGLEGFEEKARPTLGNGIGGQPDQQKANNRNVHPTVKPTALMRYIVKLVTPPGGTVLDPFTGSGSTGKAAKLEGFDFIGIEREEEYVKIAEARIKAVPDTLL